MHWQPQERRWDWGRVASWLMIAALSVGFWTWLILTVIARLDKAYGG